MKKTAILLSVIISLFMVCGCASTSKKEKAAPADKPTYAILEIGTYPLGKVQAFSDEDVVIQYLYEETTKLKVENIDGKDYYKGTCLAGMPMTEIKALMGEEKFAAYWAICFEIGQLEKGIDHRLIKYIFSNKDYFIIDMQGNIQEDMNMNQTHSDPDELIELQILLPITIE